MTMSCEFRTLVPLSVSASLLRRLVSRVFTAVRLNPRTTNVALAFVGDARMKFLNRRYRRQNRTTDVLSFSGMGSELGDIVISVPQAKRQAQRFGTTLLDEISLLIVHGLLHLTGYDHRTRAERIRMQRKERRILYGSSLIHRQSTSQ
ncbi:MAG: rRNA maturation RNase YbeY [Candidatus Kerfeldbacteria bacterium]|nr:rRNA maturation RNase YbeY [Candidatus Kerfeldbacteria bacterium]